MLEYVVSVLKHFPHHQPQRLQHQSHPHVRPTIYRVKAQYVPDVDDLSLLVPSNKKFVHEVTGTFLYYARVVDLTMLTTLGSIATQ